VNEVNAGVAATFDTNQLASQSAMSNETRLSRGKCALPIATGGLEQLQQFREPAHAPDRKSELSAFNRNLHVL
jgi:hypothetical protein